MTNEQIFCKNPSPVICIFPYREALSHDNVTFNANGTLTAFPNHPLKWVPEMSEGHQEDDELILPNIALLVSHFSPFLL